MSLHRSLIPLAVVLSLVAAACSSTPETLASFDDASADVSTDDASTQDAPTDEELAESLSGQAVAVDPNTDQSDVDEDPDVSTVDETTSSTTELATTTTSTTTTEAPSCVSPGDVSRWVDVAADDPDGGLNVRANAGAGNEILDVLPRNSEVGLTGGCVTVGSSDWWEVTTNNAVTGWVASRFLSETQVYTTSLGKAEADTDNVGLTADTLENLAHKIADAYGFDDDVVVTMVGNVDIADSIGGDATFDLTGAKDDSVGGYRIEILFFFLKNADATEITGFEAQRITRQTICIRGVSADGVCI